MRPNSYSTKPLASSKASSLNLDRFISFLKMLFSKKKVMIFSLILIITIFISIFAGIIAPYDPFKQDLSNALQSPSWKHWLGTDELGRDVLSRIIYGSRISLIVGLLSVSFAVIIGVIIGLIAGFFGGFIDMVLSRIIDALLAFPPIILALALGAALGAGKWTVIIALTISLIPSYARVMRAEVLAIKELDYVKAAEVIGARRIRILIRHILPNCLSPIIVLISLNIGVAILAEASLSFLGVGITPPDPSWGAMVNEGRKYLVTHPILSFAPGMCVMIIVLAFNMVGDGLRDALDPRLRGL